MRLFLLCLLFLFTGFSAAAAPHERWVAYYTDALKADAFEPFDVIVFDSDSHPPLTMLNAHHKIILGYLSLGEAETFRSYFKEIRKKNILLKADKDWRGHRIIDIRRPEWSAYVLDTLIPKILAQGFGGVMLDTLDSPLDLEARSPKLYTGMQASAVALVKAIRARYPHIRIMMNRGFEILPQVAGDIDMLMAESIYSDWSGGDKKPKLVPDETYKHYVQIIKDAQVKAPKLKIYTMDYWPLNDTDGVKRIYRLQREQGFVPYVSAINLQTLHTEPE